MKRLYLFGVFVLIIASRFVSWETGSPIAIDGHNILVVDHGYHAGLVVLRPDLEQFGTKISKEWLRQFPKATWFEFGWGDAGFYFNVPTIADATAKIVANALLWPSESVVHVATGNNDAQRAFSLSDVIEMSLSDQAIERLVVGIERSVASTQAIGNGLYANARFYKGIGSYHIFRTCNSWVSLRLRDAGIASSSSPAPSLLSFSLMQELRLKYGVK